jgi:hypothetical protein
MNDEGSVAALELDWLFDDSFTAFVAQEFVRRTPTIRVLTRGAEHLSKQLA